MTSLNFFLIPTIIFAYFFIVHPTGHFFSPAFLGLSEYFGCCDRNCF